jgi:DNA polymerase III subunit delta
MARQTNAPQLDAGHRIVVLHGKERFLREEYTRRLQHLLDEAHGGVQVFRFEGEQIDPAAILDELRSYGLLQEHKLVIVDQADQFLSGRADDGASRSAGPRALLERYAAQPADHATLLLRSDGWRPGKLDKLIDACGVRIKCEALSEGRAVTWCTLRCEKAHGKTLAPAAAALLVERIGEDLNRLDMELMKLASASGDETTIERDVVQRMVGMSREDVAWSIQSAVLSGSAGAAVAKLRELLDIARVAEAQLMWSLTDLARKLYAAVDLTERGVPAAAIAKELRLWGDARDGVLRAARGLDRSTAAALLEAAIEADRRSKSGIGSARRGLEALTLYVSQSIS